MSKPKTVHTIESLKARCVEEGDCWLWQGYAANKVPMVHKDGGMVSVRRLMFDLMGKRTREGYYVPVCGNKECVCPDHTRYRSQAEHVAFMNKQEFSLERRLKMTAARRARADVVLSVDKARMIRSAYGSYAEISEAYGVTKSVVGRIKQGNYWRDLNSPFAGLMR